MNESTKDFIKKFLTIFVAAFLGSLLSSLCLMHCMHHHHPHPMHHMHIHTFMPKMHNFEREFKNFEGKMDRKFKKPFFDEEFIEEDYIIMPKKFVGKDNEPVEKK